MSPANRRTIPTAVLTQAKRLAEVVGPKQEGPAAARAVPAPPSPPRLARSPLDRAKREKLVAALKRLHPMD